MEVYAVEGMPIAADIYASAAPLLSLHLCQFGAIMQNRVMFMIGLICI